MTLDEEASRLERAARDGDGEAAMRLLELRPRIFAARMVDHAVGNRNCEGGWCRMAFHGEFELPQPPRVCAGWDLKKIKDIGCAGTMHALDVERIESGRNLWLVTLACDRCAFVTRTVTVGGSRVVR